MLDDLSPAERAKLAEFEQRQHEERMQDPEFRKGWERMADLLRRADGHDAAIQRAEQAEAAIERVRKRHRAMDIYFGDERCLEDAECYAEQDYPEHGGSATGGFCPHTLKAATICTACSQMDSKTESWPEDRWVLFENCKTLAVLDTPTPTEEGSDV